MDHLSNHSFDQTLSIAEGLQNSDGEAEPRSVIASHVQFFDLNEEEIRHERMRTEAQLDRIRNVAGWLLRCSKMTSRTRTIPVKAQYCLHQPIR